MYTVTVVAQSYLQEITDRTTTTSDHENIEICMEHMLHIILRRLDGTGSEIAPSEGGGTGLQAGVTLRTLAGGRSDGEIHDSEPAAVGEPIGAETGRTFLLADTTGVHRTLGPEGVRKSSRRASAQAASGAQAGAR